MSNLLVEIGNTAVKAAWAEEMTLGKTFRYQGERKMEFITGLIEKEKPGVMVIASVYELSAQDQHLLETLCHQLVILDPAHPLTAEKGEESVSAAIFETGLCLPSDIKNTDEDMERIISVIRSVLA